MNDNHDTMIVYGTSFYANLTEPFWGEVELFNMRQSSYQKQSVNVLFLPRNVSTRDYLLNGGVPCKQLKHINGTNNTFEHRCYVISKFRLSLDQIDSLIRYIPQSHLKFNFAAPIESPYRECVYQPEEFLESSEDLLTLLLDKYYSFTLFVASNVEHDFEYYDLTNRNNEIVSESMPAIHFRPVGERKNPSRKYALGHLRNEELLAAKTFDATPNKGFGVVMYHLRGLDDETNVLQLKQPEGGFAALIFKPCGVFWLISKSATLVGGRHPTERMGVSNLQLNDESPTSLNVKLAEFYKMGFSDVMFGQSCLYAVDPEDGLLLFTGTMDSDILKHNDFMLEFME